MTKKGNLNRYDLMIGDLVIAQPDEDVCGEVGTIVSRITEIFDDCGVMSVNLEDFDYSVAIGLLEPLPITKEILEKNGFKWDGKMSWVWKYIIPRNTDIMYQDDVVWFNKEFPWQRKDGLQTVGWLGATSQSGHVDMEGEYVHQLQQAIRFCKIEKEIEV